jgi:hypothetical protein
MDLASRRGMMSDPEQVRPADSLLDRAPHIVDSRNHEAHVGRLEQAGIDVAEAERTDQRKIRR